MTSPPLTVLRADLHVHSWHSRVNGDLPFLRSRDSYSAPADVYRVARARGMHVVTITDHDSIDGCLELLEAHPDATDLIVGEEVSCRLPDGDIEVHLGVYGMTERLHAELQPLRRNVFDVTARLREAGVFHAINHLFHFYRGQAPLDTYLRLLSAVPALEIRNGTMLSAHNALVAEFREHWLSQAPPLAMVAGSDAHTLRRVGRTWTEAPARNAHELGAAIAAGLGRPGGRHGGAHAVAGDAYGVIARYCASVFGRGPQDHEPWHRALCVALIVASVPMQFVPALVATIAKRRERRAIVAAAEWLAEARGPSCALTAVTPAGPRW